MDLTPYLESLRRDLAAAAAPGGDAAARSAEMLSTALESAARLCLLEALSDAAAEITTKLDTSSVEVRLRGRDAELVVTDGAPTAAPPPPPMVGDPGGDVARITLRLPEVLKEQAERAATEEGISVNAWLVRAVATALQGYGSWPPGPPGAPPPPGAPWPPGPPGPPGGFFPGPGGPPPGGRGRRPRRMTGWAQA
jgi:hypothetical protein